MNGDNSVQDERKMIPVSPDTHRRVMAYAGLLTAKRGARTSMEYAIINALDLADDENQVSSANPAEQSEQPAAAESVNA